uniref:Incilarin A n=1 Tax=Meghimatium fruhstorferi TaxID=414506 RepID=O02581_MEGFU|nr:Incilarin A [Meghimatium fruhstorferi]
MIRIVLLLVLAAQCVFCACPNGWKEFKGYCYGFYPEKVNWLVASASCNLYGGRLPEIDSEQRDQWLLAELTALKFGETWAGGSARLHVGKWEWVPSLRDFSRHSHWNAGEPNNVANNEYCLEINQSPAKGWNDKACTEERQFICERRVDA